MTLGTFLKRYEPQIIHLWSEDSHSDLTGLILRSNEIRNENYLAPAWVYSDSALAFMSVWSELHFILLSWAMQMQNTGQNDNFKRGDFYGIIWNVSPYFEVFKLRSSCSFCFQMLGFLIRAKHCECSDILQIFVADYLEEPCRVMGRSPKLECVIEQNKNSVLIDRSHLPEEAFWWPATVTQAYRLQLSWLQQAPHHRTSTIYRAFFERSAGKFCFLFFFFLSSKDFLVFWHHLESKLWKTPWLRALGGGERFYIKSKLLSIRSL